MFSCPSNYVSRLLFCFVALACTASAVPLQAEVARFSAMLAGGQRIEGERLTEWHQRAKLPRLDNKELMNEGNPLIWLRDRQLQPGKTPSAYVETISGDRLPGEVVQHVRSDSPGQWESLPAHFVVAPSVDVYPPRAKARPPVRVVERYVRRIVWQARPGSERYQPGTVFLKDGRTMQFRAARFTPEGVKVLQATEQQQLAFADISQLHLPAADPWESYYDELAILSPECEDRLLQIDSVDGLIATGSMLQFMATSGGNAGDSDNWFHGVQPAWSLDVLWMRNNKIWMRRGWRPEAVPLSHIAPNGSESSSMIVKGPRSWKRNFSVAGAPLQSAKGDFGWGFGVHAYSELHFPLPLMATAFRTRVGLDESVGEGGCVIARVFADSVESQPLNQSPHLVGSAQLHDSQNLNITAHAKEGKSLILQIDPAHNGRPAKADPLDIRDRTDWLDPVVMLESDQLLAEVASRRASRVPAFDGWQLVLAADGEYKFRSDLQREDSSDSGSFRPQISVRKQPLFLRRKLKVGPQHQWLMVSTYRRRGSPPQGEILVRIDGIDIAEQAVPLHNTQSVPPPLAVSLSPYLGHEIDIEVAQLPTPDPGLPPVFWHALKISDQLPVLHCVVEDDAALAPIGNAAALPIQFTDADKYSGQRSLNVPQGGKVRIKLNRPIAVRSSPSLGEQRFLRFAFRKQGGGEVRIELEHEDSAQRPAIYSAGVPAPTDDQFAETIWFDDELPPGATVDGSEAGESFHWTGREGGPVRSGKLAVHRRANGVQQQSFVVEEGLRLSAGDRLFAFAHLDPKSPPRAVMLQFQTGDGKWRRAYWGENVIPLGSDNTPERMRMGNLPNPGKWARLEVPIEKLSIKHGDLVKGCALTQHGGALWWDACGVRKPRGGPVFPATNVWRLELPEEWIVVTRNVFTDFGAMDVTGVVLHVPDGDSALIDHVCFASNAEAYQQLREAPSPELTNEQARRELAKAVLDKGHPATVAVLVEDRQATGVLVGSDGFVLTAGHVFGAPNRECEIQLPTGQRLPAKTLGICRSADLGIIQITDRKDQPLPGLQLHDAKEFPSNQLYVGFALEPFVAETPGAVAHVVGIQRDFRETLWSDFHLDNATTGGPLLSRDGRIIGTQIRGSRFGGFLYSKSFVALEHWERMKKGEVWGDWFPGAGPMLGVIITSAAEGAKVTEVMPDTPAAAAGVEVGDIVTQLDGQPTQSLDDVYRLLATKDPGLEVAVQLNRDGNNISKKIKLMPRVP